MRGPTRSYLKVAYDLRPAKQIERRMLVDALQRLGEDGFDIRNYQYTGFGSFYFVDFILLRRFLGIHRLVSVEHSREIRKRVLFNKPFGDIEVDFRPVSDVIPELSRDRKHLLWLDFDDVIYAGMMEDITAAASQLSVGSILLVTVDVEPPPVEGSGAGAAKSGPADWMAYFEEEARVFLSPTLKKRDFARSKLPQRSVELVGAAIGAGLAGRVDTSFLPLFNFLYRDGHLMATVGGMLGTESEARRLATVNWADAAYIRRRLDVEPYVIRLPRLTRKERLFLDSEMPCPSGWAPKEFELSAEDVAAYREVYRFYPSFAELLLG